MASFKARPVRRGRSPWMSAPPIGPQPGRFMQTVPVRGGSSDGSGGSAGHQILSGSDLARIAARMAHQILEKTRGAEHTVLLGVPTRGVPLAYRLADRIAAFEGVEVPVGTLDVTLYRD